MKILLKLATGKDVIKLQKSKIYSSKAPIIIYNPENGSKAMGTGVGRMFKPPTRRERAEELYQTLKSKSKADKEKSERDAFLDDLL